ncbi:MULTISPECIES: multidrug efflux SMR transporter protein HsmR [Halobacterium]|uniref:Smr family transport protein n=4 Tax=Halobacterium salinarum TaxID=2242 RepID=A0A510N7W0_HALSA|nr:MULTISPECIES: multidrug efflux SMR transporter protein HsmR [Halobacterium]MBB6089093.1 small multidrug resistance pump [Halobacterium salinarum]MDL0119523.1 multidrug efflux SMR transporter protein HsmR [Halobacterium salinarum]MDL0123380.1 multidrug efflux SMR transporter protein HsmR [Halobacterium salinarum]MDL0132186.1 multidrug efflux SMR transporter protein HsmR [Halobacterium salinarum]MDL0137366.1 multidrug efflux SMR transporter protein HsmR [Halobacterium salinarum]
MHPYAYLAAAIAAEVAGTTALKLSEGFSNPAPSVVVLVGYVSSFYFLGLVLEELPVGVVYGTWAAVGIVATALVGVVVFEESVDVAGVVGLALIVAGVVVLNVASDAYTPAH